MSGSWKRPQSEAWTAVRCPRCDRFLCRVKAASEGSVVEIVCNKGCHALVSWTPGGVTFTERRRSDEANTEPVRG